MSVTNVRGFFPVALAVGSNAFVALLKFIAAFASGSAAMFSEAVHSVVDTLNQALLLIGIRRSLKKADGRFDYGYGNERFFWALISACGIFFLGAGVTAFNGIDAILNPEPIEYSFLLFAVLAVALLFESITLYVAIQEIKKNLPNGTWQERLRKADSGTLAVLLEDSVAILGVCIAGITIGLSYITANPVWDGIGSILVSILLAIAAVLLIERNRGYLLGKAIPEMVRDGVIELLEKDPAIEKVIDFKSSAIGFGAYRIKCEVEFNGVALLRDAHRGTSLTDEYKEIEDVEDFKRFASDYADRIPRLMGTKIDELEKEIRIRYPSIRDIDIEIN